MSKPTTNCDAVRRWAKEQGALPAEILPDRVNGAPAELGFLMPGEKLPQERVRVISCEDFCAGFEVHGLAFTHEVRADGSAGRGWELLQIDAGRPTRPVGDESQEQAEEEYWDESQAQNED